MKPSDVLNAWRKAWVRVVMAAAITLVLVGFAWSLDKEYIKESGIFRASEEVTWPTTFATEADTRIEKQTPGSGPFSTGADYSVEVAYRYRVDGKDYLTDWQVVEIYDQSPFAESHAGEIRSRILNGNPFRTIIRYDPENVIRSSFQLTDRSQPSSWTIVPSVLALAAFGWLVWELLAIGRRRSLHNP